MGIVVPVRARLTLKATPADNPAEAYTLWHLSSRRGVLVSPEGNPIAHAFTPLKTTWTGRLRSKRDPLLIVHFVHTSRYEPLRRGELPVEVFSPGRRTPDSQRLERGTLPG